MNVLIGPLLAVALLGSAAGSGQSSETKPAQAQSPAQEKLTALIQRFQAKQKEVSQAYEAATTDAERSKILAGMPGKDFAPEFRAIAEEAKGTDTAVRAWLWVMRLEGSDPKRVAEIVELLLADHMQSEALAELPPYMRRGSDPAQMVESLRAMVAESPHPKVRASALYALGSTMLESKSADERTEGRRCLEKVVADYGDLQYGSSSTYGAVAGGQLFELDHLQLGMNAPDFQTVDENGVAWKLSDYKGKVVVVDFWGDW